VDAEAADQRGRDNKRHRRIRKREFCEESPKLLKVTRKWWPLTRWVLAWGGSTRKITASLSLTLSLEIAINSIVAVILHSVRLETCSILKNRGTISSCTTCVIYSFLKSLITHTIFTYTVKSTCSRPENVNRRTVSPLKIPSFLKSTSTRKVPKQNPSQNPSFITKPKQKNSNRKQS